MKRQIKIRGRDGGTRAVSDDYVLRDGETCVLFRAGDAASLADAIMRLLGQRDRWPLLRDQGRRFVEQERTWATRVAGYRAVFDSLGLATR